MLKKMMFVLCTLLLMSVSSQATQWEVDAVHSSIQFKVSHMVISSVVGGFTEFSGTINLEAENPVKGSVELTISVASIDTQDENRDKHLLSGDFFNVEEYPEIKFKSTKVIPGEGGAFDLVGQMTMLDVTKEVTFECKYNGSIKLEKGSKAGFSAQTTINRQDFGITWSKTLDAGGLALGNDIEITMNLECNSVE